MKKVILLQAPAKLFEVIPIFYKEASKYKLFDKFYIASDHPKPYGLGEDCFYLQLKRDKQFASNILSLLPHVEEDIFMICCEDQIMNTDNSVEDLSSCYDFVEQNKNVGYLRLSWHDRVPFDKGASGLFGKLKKGYSYYISLQPSIWRREYLEAAFKSGENAWEVELKGSKRVKNHPKFRSYGVTRPVYDALNFYKKGKYLRQDFVKYAEANGIEISNTMEGVYVKNKTKRDVKIIPFQSYIEGRGK